VGEKEGGSSLAFMDGMGWSISPGSAGEEREEGEGAKPGRSKHYSIWSRPTVGEEQVGRKKIFNTYS
jgi:hypothetical protein